ncbi:MAG: oxygenase MpaB family protein [Solirubrobacterales bacterium]
MPGFGSDHTEFAADIDGFFPAGSMIRRLHGERLIAFSGVRALLMQACDPLAVVGFDRHSVIFSDPRKRLMSTDVRMSRMYFGSTELATSTGAAIQKMHGRVKGTVDEDYGPVPAGTKYAADDPELMLWTLATLADSALVYWDRFCGSLTSEERQSYWSDYRQIGMLLGMPSSSIPETEPELRDYVKGRMNDGSLYISDDVRDRSKGIIFNPPFGGWQKVAATPMTEAIKLSSIGFLPPEIRDLYGFGWDPVRETVLATSILQIRLARPFWLDAVRKHPAARTPAGAVFGGRTA